MSSRQNRYFPRQKSEPRRSPLNAATAEAKKNAARANAIISKIVAQFVSRSKVDIKKWRDAIAQAENDRYPKRNQWARLIKDLDLDAHWTSQITLLKLSIMRKPFVVVDKATRKELPERTRQFQAPWFYELMSVWFDAKAYGTQAVEIQDLLAGNQKWDAIFQIPQGHIIPERKQICRKDTDNQGEYYGDDPYVLWFDEDTFMGLLCKAAPHIIYKKNALQSWAEFCEKFGIPLRYATTNKKDQATIDKLEKMLDELGSAARAIFPEGTNIDFKEANSQDAFQVFDQAILRNNEEVSKLVNGVTMISDNGSSKSQSEVHERMNQKIVDSLAADFQGTLAWYILPQLVSLGFDFNPEKEEWVWDETERLSLGALWNIVQGVVKFYEVDQKWLTEKFGIPITGVRSTPITTSGDINPAPANFNKPQPLANVEAMAAYAKLMAKQTTKLHAPENSLVTTLFTAAATKFFENPNNKPDALNEKEWTDLFDYVAQKFFAGAEDGYGVKLTTELEGGDKEFLQTLRTNLYHFSAMKNYQLLQTLNGMLTDAEGKLREKSDFMKLALESNTDYNKNWLETEYNMAVGKATGQARQKQFIAEAEDYDLMWQTVGDDRVRVSHEVNDGMVVAADSDIAKSLVFPIDWGCRCEWVQVPKGSRTRTPSTEIKLPELGTGLTNDYGKVFSETHPYWNGVTNNERNALKDFADNQIKKLD